MIIKFRKRPIEIEAIQWVNNEPEIRLFIGNDSNVKFKDGGTLELWNDEKQSWINCPMFHWVSKGIKGELDCISPEILERTYDKLPE